MARRVRRLGEALYGLEQRAVGNVGERIRTYTTRDVTEAFVGSTLFSLPMPVEGGVFEIGEHFATSLVYGLPVYFLTDLLFVATVTAGLLYRRSRPSASGSYEIEEVRDNETPQASRTTCPRG